MGMLASSLTLAVLDALSLAFVFVCSLLTLFVTTELTEPVATTPPTTAIGEGAEDNSGVVRAVDSWARAGDLWRRDVGHAPSLAYWYV
jgi:hypothetical protein